MNILYRIKIEYRSYVNLWVITDVRHEHFLPFCSTSLIWFMMMSGGGNRFRIVGLLSGNFAACSPHKGQQRGVLMFPFISAWINSWTAESSMLWDAMELMWRYCNVRACIRHHKFGKKCSLIKNEIVMNLPHNFVTWIYQSYLTDNHIIWIKSILRFMCRKCLFMTSIE